MQACDRCPVKDARVASASVSMGLVAWANYLDARSAESGCACSGSANALHLVRLVENKVDEVEAREQRGGEVDVLNHRLKRIVVGDNSANETTCSLFTTCFSLLIGPCLLFTPY